MGAGELDIATAHVLVIGETDAGGDEDIVVYYGVRWDICPGLDGDALADSAMVVDYDAGAYQ
jgi:hypothetical protein